MCHHSGVPRGPEGTIYEKERGFDQKLRIEIDPAKITFIKELNRSKASSVFHVKYSDKPRVLKVFHNNGDPGYSDNGFRDLNRARCEIRAYCRLKQSGLCDKGYVPQFYGYTFLNPTDLEPHLSAFKHDAGLPSAILIEYLADSFSMDCVTYTEERMNKAIAGIKQIHSAALIEHRDPYPKNIRIVPGNPERVLWIDFDVAITYPDSSYIGEQSRRWLDIEVARVKGVGECLANDQKQGRPPNTEFY